MRLLLFAAVFATALIPASESFSQAIDSENVMSVITGGPPYIYKDSDGYTVVVGEIHNRNALTSMSEIVVRAIFYDEFGEQIIEIVSGHTVLEVVPPESSSPYVITSASDNPEIGQASVSVEAFNSSPAKSVGLELSDIDIVHGEVLNIDGYVTNTGKAPSQNTTVYLAFHDAFDPPRLLHVEPIPAGDIPIDGEAHFSFSETPNPAAVGVRMLAESDIFHSESASMAIPPQNIMTSLVTISNTVITDSEGESASSIAAGSTVTVSSDLVFETIADDRLQPFVYYVQVKQSGQVPYVEFLDTATGSFHGTPDEDASVQWTPQNPGLYFVETFVWDQDGVPIASTGPVVVVVVT